MKLFDNWYYERSEDRVLCPVCGESHRMFFWRPEEMSLMCLKCFCEKLISINKDDAAGAPVPSPCSKETEMKIISGGK